LGVTTFFCEVLEHLLVEHQFGHQELEPLEFDLEFAAPAVGVDPRRVVTLSPAMIGRLSDADLSANVRDRQPLGQVAVGVPEQSRHFVGAPSFPHESLLDTVYRGTPISCGPVFGEQTIPVACDHLRYFRDPAGLNALAAALVEAG
jgi:hypothetical protein